MAKYWFPPLDVVADIACRRLIVDKDVVLNGGGWRRDSVGMARKVILRVAMERGYTGAQVASYLNKTDTNITTHFSRMVGDRAAMGISDEVGVAVDRLCPEDGKEAQKRPPAEARVVSAKEVERRRARYKARHG